MGLRPRNLLIGGAVALGGALWGWYVYRKSKAAKKPKAIPIPKALIIQILKEQGRDSYRVLQFTAQVFTAYLEQQRELNIEMPYENTKEEVFATYPIGQKLDDVVKNILNKYGINEKEYIDALEVTYKDDQDVKNVRQIFWNDFAKACSGIPPAIDYTIPDFLTPEKILQVRAKLLIQEAELIAKFLEPVDQEGLAFWEDEAKVLRFMTYVGFALETNNERTRIFVEEGFNDFEESPERIYDAAVAHYLTTEPEFKQIFDDLARERVHFTEELEKRRPQEVFASTFENLEQPEQLFEE